MNSDNLFFNKLRTDGYYLHENFKEEGLSFLLKPEIVFTEHGNAVLTYTFSRIKYKAENENWCENIGNYIKTEWPQYFISGDSIIIQYFQNTETSGAFIGWNKYTVIEIRGKILNDTTFVVPQVRYNSASEFYGVKGVQDEFFLTPQIYHFVKFDSLPPFQDWIKTNKLCEKDN